MPPRTPSHRSMESPWRVAAQGDSLASPRRIVRVFEHKCDEVVSEHAKLALLPGNRIRSRCLRASKACAGSVPELRRTYWPPGQVPERSKATSVALHGSETS